MVEAREPEEMPEPSEGLQEMKLSEVLNLKLRDADDDPQWEAMMWKSVAAKNIEDIDERPHAPESVAGLSENELESVKLGECSGRAEMLQLLEWGVYPRT